MFFMNNKILQNYLFFMGKIDFPAALNSMVETKFGLGSFLIY